MTWTVDESKSVAQVDWYWGCWETAQGHTLTHQHYKCTCLGILPNFGHSIHVQFYSIMYTCACVCAHKNAHQ